MAENASGGGRVRLPPGSPCTNCGKCWRRGDILRFAAVLGEPDDPYADLWVDRFAGVERERCPFVRKVRGQNRYLCTIYETRPQVCRDYVPWSGEDNDVCEVVED